MKLNIVGVLLGGVFAVMAVLASQASLKAQQGSDFQGTRIPSPYALQGTRIPSPYALQGTRIPSPYALQGTRIPSPYALQGTRIPSPYAA